MRILVIEDEFRLQNQIRQQLEAAGYCGRYLRQWRRRPVSLLNIRLMQPS